MRAQPRAAFPQPWGGMGVLPWSPKQYVHVGVTFTLSVTCTKSSTYVFHLYHSFKSSNLAQKKKKKEEEKEETKAMAAGEQLTQQHTIQRFPIPSPAGEGFVRQNK